VLILGQILLEGVHTIASLRCGNVKQPEGQEVLLADTYNVTDQQ
jgi:hypothetical protein